MTTQNYVSTANSVEDDEFDNLFNFTSPSTTLAVTGKTDVLPVKESLSIQFGLDSDSSDTEFVASDAAPSENNASIDSSSYFNVSSTGTPTPSTDGRKKGEANFASDMNNSFEDSSSRSLLALERQGDDDFQELDETTRDFLDWLDQEPKSSTAIIDNKREMTSVEMQNKVDDLDFVNIHIPEKSMVEKVGNLSKEGKNSKTALLLEHEEGGVKSSLSTIAVITETEDGATQVQLPQPLIPKVPTTKELTLPSCRSNAILTESKSNEVEDVIPSDKKESDRMTEGNENDSLNRSRNGDDLLLKNESEIEEVEISFANLSEAIRSPKSDVQKHILPFLQSNTHVSMEDRSWLWTKVICGKILTEIKLSSLADSFGTWDQNFNLLDLEDIDRLTKFGVEKDLVVKLLKEVDCLADWILTRKHKDSQITKINVKRDLSCLLLFYYKGGSTKNMTSTNQMEIIESDTIDQGENQAVCQKAKQIMTEDKLQKEEIGNGDKVYNTEKENSTEITQGQNKERMFEAATKVVEWNPLIAPIAATLMSSSVPIAVASVMLSAIIPMAMPLVSLTSSERFHAAKEIHSQFYFLACYHLPMLVLHLDRYVPGWYWPIDCAKVKKLDSEICVESATKKGRNLQSHGVISMTWFISQLATTALEPEKILHLWDVLLTFNDHSFPFFLALALLEKHSDKLLMLSGNALITALTAVMSFDETTVEVTIGNDENGKGDDTPMNEFFGVWFDHALLMRDSTPPSVVYSLRKAEDEAVDLAFQLRHKEAMDKLKVRLETEADAHWKLMEERRAEKEEEAQYTLHKARLEKFYKRHCPDRVKRVDSVLEVYKGRFDVLNQRLISKYGTGFIPLFNQKLSVKTNNLLSSVGHGIRGKKKDFIAARVGEKTKELFGDIGMALKRTKHQVAVNVKASEILPIVCGGKTLKSSIETQSTLKYYLVDSRPEEIATLQGRFPTSAQLSPEELMDPDSMHQKIEMFESLRGAVHICIMGEGFSSFHSLYDHPLSENELSLLDDDESRTNICALFFIKRGFPFVSILDGGFAAAHAWLARDCKELSITSVLVDYDVSTSLFAQLEYSYRDHIESANASASQKATRAIQELIDRSMIRLTMSENRIEEFTDRLRTEVGRKEVKESVAKIFQKSTEVRNVKKDSINNMRFGNFIKRNQDYATADSRVRNEGEVQDKIRSKKTVSNQKQRESDERPFKNAFSVLRKIGTEEKGNAKFDQPVIQEKQNFGFLSRAKAEKIKKIDSSNPGIQCEEQKLAVSHTKRNFGFLSRREVGEKKFHLSNISMSTFNKQSFTRKPSGMKAGTFNLKSNLFTKNVMKSEDDDIERAISECLEESGMEKSNQKPVSLHQKFAGFTKTASDSIKVAAKSTSQANHPMMAFQKKSSINVSKPRLRSEEESVLFEGLEEITHDVGDEVKT